MKIYLAKFNSIIAPKKTTRAFLRESDAEKFVEEQNTALLNEFNEYMDELGEEPADYDEYCGDDFNDVWEVEEVEVEG